MDFNSEKQPTSIRLSSEAKMLVEELSNTFGISQTAAIEQAIRRWARQEAITISTETRAKFESFDAVAANEKDAIAALAKQGYITQRLQNDPQGADFTAQHPSNGVVLKVKQKKRLWFEKSYIGKGLHIAFPADGEWYLYPHDELLDVVLANTNIGNTQAWQRDNLYHFPYLSRKLRPLLAPYKIGA